MNIDWEAVHSLGLVGAVVLGFVLLWVFRRPLNDFLMACGRDCIASSHNAGRSSSSFSDMGIGSQGWEHRVNHNKLRCSNCGMYGCSGEGCFLQRFKGWTCLNCGQNGSISR